MSAPAFPRAALLALAEGRPSERAVTVTLHPRVLLEAVAAYDAAERQVTISQHAATVTQIAHEWATARRAHLTRKPAEPVVVKGFTSGWSREPPDEWYGPAPETTQSANRLSGLARRLERACLGPRPARVILARPTEDKP